MSTGGGVMRLEFTCTPDDSDEAIEATRPQPPPVSRLGSAVGWVVFIGIAVILMFAHQANLGEKNPLISPLERIVATLPCVTGLLLLIAGLAAFVWRQKRQFRQFRESLPPYQPQVLELSDTGLTLSDPVAATTWPWTSVASCTETPGLFVVHMINKGFVMIPKRAAPAERLDELRLLIRSHIPKL